VRGDGKAVVEEENIEEELLYERRALGDVKDGLSFLSESLDLVEIGDFPRY